MVHLLKVLKLQRFTQVERNEIFKPKDVCSCIFDPNTFLFCRI